MLDGLLELGRTAVLAEGKIILLRALIDDAWRIIASAGQGDWSRESAEWKAAAERWRDDFHKIDETVNNFGKRQPASTGAKE